MNKDYYNKLIEEEIKKLISDFEVERYYKEQ